MSLEAQLVRGGSPGEWYVEHSYAEYFRPMRCYVRWRVLRSEVRGLGCWDECDTDGAKVDHLSSNEVAQCSTWQAYKGGTYLVVTTEREGTTRQEPVPPPKVRAGTSIRWNLGRWEKYLKTKGYVPA
jgi:hypothetical protein